MFVCCQCYVLSGRGLCDRLITRPEKSYRLWRVVVCDQENSKTRRLKPATGQWKIQQQWVVTPVKRTNCIVVLCSLRYCRITDTRTWEVRWTGRPIRNCCGKTTSINCLGLCSLLHRGTVLTEIL
jgi:hypothetical protein